MVKSTRLFVLGLGAVAMGACADSSPTGLRSLSSSTGPNRLIVGVGAQGPGPVSYPLYAGGGGGSTGTLVGQVVVTSADDPASADPNDFLVTVTYNMVGGFCLDETHLQVALQLSGIPQKNGNPIPGQFDNKHTLGCASSDTYTVKVDLGTATANGVVIAAHSVVHGVSSPIFAGANYVSGSSMVANLVHRRAGNVGSWTNVSGALVAAWEPPAGADPSLWDNQIALDPNGQWLQAHGADWVWESNRVLDPIQGTVIEADAVINVPVATTGTLRITCDNGYRVDFNGTPLTTGDGGSSGFGTQLSTTFSSQIGTNTDLKQANVSGDGWETVESYSVNLLAGNNTFKIYGVNEFMNTGDTHPGYTGVRPADGDPVGNIDNNPAGCIFGVAAAAVPSTGGSGSETAWGAPNDFTGAPDAATTNQGGNFPGKNWATWFVYKVR